MKKIILLLTTLNLGMLQLKADIDEVILQKIQNESLDQCYIFLMQEKFKLPSIETKDVANHTKKLQDKKQIEKNILLLDEIREKFVAEIDYKKLFSDISYAQIWHERLKNWRKLFDASGGTGNIMMATICAQHDAFLKIYLASHKSIDLLQYTGNNKVPHINIKEFYIKYARNENEMKFTNEISGKENAFQFTQILNESYKIECNINYNFSYSSFMLDSNPYNLLMANVIINVQESEYLECLQKYIEGGGDMGKLKTISYADFNRITNNWRGRYAFLSRNDIGLIDIKNFTIGLNERSDERTIQKLKSMFE